MKLADARKALGVEIKKNWYLVTAIKVNLNPLVVCFQNQLLKRQLDYFNSPKVIQSNSGKNVMEATIFNRKTKGTNN